MERAFPRTALDLARLQREFQAYVLHRDPAVLQHVLGAGAADAATRMDVYADGYPLRLLEALQTDYPGLRAITGGQDFEALGRAFIAACPSTLRNLRWYGERLSPFLETSPPWSDRCELADMARFEWAMACSFDALDAAGLHPRTGIQSMLARNARVSSAPASRPHGSSHAGGRGNSCAQFLARTGIGVGLVRP